MEFILRPDSPLARYREIVRLAAEFLPMFQKSERQFAGVRMSASQYLAHWDSPTASAVTKHSDWHPSEFRQQPTTLYLTVPMQVMETYSALLRVIIGQHLNELMRVEPPRDSLPVVFLLDEFPKLGHMKPVIDALDTGRSYRIKLWYVMQYVDQLKSAYRGLADGILGACGARIFLSPGQDIAHGLERELGQSTDFLTGKKEPLATAQELMGPSFHNQQLVLVPGHRPARLLKDMAFRNLQQVKS